MLVTHSNIHIDYPPYTDTTPGGHWASGVAIAYCSGHKIYDNVTYSASVPYRTLKSIDMTGFTDMNFLKSQQRRIRQKLLQHVLSMFCKAFITNRKDEYVV